MSDIDPAIVVVGSANVDLIVRTDRLPGAGETVVGGEFLTAGGGKGANQAIAARRLGAAVSFVARVGDDSAGQFALTCFREAGLDLEWLTIDREAATGVALIIVDAQGQNLIAVASGANSRLTSADVRRAEPAIGRSRVLIVQLEVALETVTEALELARQCGLTTVLNPAPARQVEDSLLRLVDWLTPNEIEASLLSGIDVVDRSSATYAATKLVERGARNVVITLGRNGAIHATGGSARHLEAFPIAAVDTTAAGDAFTAGLAVSLALGRSSHDALTYASATGALATTRAGAQPSLPHRIDVDNLVATRVSPARAT